VAIGLPFCVAAQATVARPTTVAPPTAVGHPATMNTMVVNASAMSVKPMPPNAAALHAKLAPQMISSVSGWVQSEAKVIEGRNLSSDAMISMARKDVSSRFAAQNMSTMDVDQMVTLIMMQCSADAQKDTKAMLAEMQAANQKKKAMRAAQDSLKDQKDALSDMSQEQQLKMQMMMDRMSKAEQAMSNMMKKASETSSGIISNLKD
jgi:hypothetical protein